MAADLSYKIKAYLGREVNFSTPYKTGEVTLENHGQGDKITYWADSIEKSKPTDSQLNAVQAQADDDLALLKLRKKRKKEYGLINDQLDMLYKDLVAGKLDATGEWAKAIKKVKDDNPKR